VDQQDRKQRTLSTADDGDRTAALVHLERTQDPEIHGSTLPA
jgi:hypothetical protein